MQPVIAESVIVPNRAATVRPVYAAIVVVVAKFVVINLITPSATTARVGASCPVRHEQATVRPAFASHYVVTPAYLAAYGNVGAVLNPVVLDKKKIRPAKARRTLK